MLKRYQRTVGLLFKAADACIVVAAWLASYWSRFFLPPFPVTKGLPEFETYASLTPLIAVLWLVVFSWLRVYESRRMTGRAAEVLMIMRAHACALLAFVTITYMFEDYRYSRLVIAYFALVG